MEQPLEIVSKQRLRFAMVCAANNNRSMEAHNVLRRHNFNVRGRTLARKIAAHGCLLKGKGGLTTHGPVHPYMPDVCTCMRA